MMLTTATVPYRRLNAASYIQYTMPARTSTPLLTPKLASLPTTPSDAGTMSKLGDLYQRRSVQYPGSKLQSTYVKRFSSIARPLPFRFQYQRPCVGLDVLERELEYDPQALRPTKSTETVKSQVAAQAAEDAIEPEQGAAWTREWLESMNIQQPAEAKLFPPYRRIGMYEGRLLTPIDHPATVEEANDGSRPVDLEAGKSMAHFGKRQKLKLVVVIVTVILSVCLLSGLIAGIAAQK